MSSVTLHSNWTIQLSTPELRLVLKALGGRLDTEQEIMDAEDLGDKLSASRAIATKDGLKYADQLLSKVLNDPVS